MTTTGGTNDRGQFNTAASVAGASLTPPQASTDQSALEPRVIALETMIKSIFDEQQVSAGGNNGA